MRKYVDEDELASLLNAKQNTPNIITNIENPLMLNDNTEYRLSNISSLTLSYPEGNFEVWMNISFSSTEPINVVFPDETRYIGAVPVFNNGQTWEISIKDGVAVCWRVE